MAGYDKISRWRTKMAAAILRNMKNCILKNAYIYQKSIILSSSYLLKHPNGCPMTDFDVPGKIIGPYHCLRAN